MENASKALIMAASILLGVMIITFGVFLFNIFGSFAKEQQDEIAKTNIQQFNNQFVKYEGDGNTVHDIVTVIHLAKDINEGSANTGKAVSQEKEGYGKIKVRIAGNTKINQDSSVDTLNQFMQNGYDASGNPKQYYRCSVKVSSSNGRINEIIFE